MELAAAASFRQTTGGADDAAWTTTSGAFAAAACCVLLLLLGGCQRAEPDYRACASASSTVASGPPDKQLVAPEIQKCMVGRGWRLLRPNLPPGSNAWARIPGEADSTLARRPVPEAGEHRSK
jgi:hypothetical protein